MVRSKIFLLMLAGAFVVTLGPAAAAPDLLVAGGKTWRVSVASTGGQGNEPATSPSISGDGRYVAFDSWADNLVAGDTNETSDVFVHDNQTGETIRVSVAADGAQGNGYSGGPSLSADGRYVVIHSGASNLVAGDADLCHDMYGAPLNCSDIFVYDLHTGQIDLVSRATGGAQGNGPSYTPSISADGRVVAFSSSASNLVPGDTAMCRHYDGREYNCPDVFVHDRQTGQTTRVSVTSNGQQGNAGSDGATISADGRTVAFSSGADNLVPNDTNSVGDVFVHDRQTAETSRISVASDGTQGASGATAALISGDGRYVTFTAWDGGFVPDDNNHTWDVFVHDRQTAETRRVSATADGTPANSSSFYGAISADGRFVTFASHATNLIPGDTEQAGVVLRNMETGEVRRVSVAVDGTAAGGSEHELAVSIDGRFVAFTSWDDDLITGDTNETGDVFVHDSRKLAINHETGAPSSYFTLSGAGYPAGSAAPVTVNGQMIGNVPVDNGGHVSFLLDTTDAGAGVHFVSVDSDRSLTVTFVLDNTQPVRPQEGDGPILQIPSGLSPAESSFLPLAFNVAGGGPQWVGPAARVSVASD